MVWSSYTDYIRLPAGRTLPTRVAGPMRVSVTAREMSAGLPRNCALYFISHRVMSGSNMYAVQPVLETMIIWWRAPSTMTAR